jgi:hypothetical protein
VFAATGEPGHPPHVCVVRVLGLGRKCKIEFPEHPRFIFLLGKPQGTKEVYATLAPDPKGVAVGILIRHQQLRVRVARVGEEQVRQLVGQRLGRSTAHDDAGNALGREFEQVHRLALGIGEVRVRGFGKR